MPLSLIMDGIILLFLAATIFYALRLSSQLRILRESKTEFEQLVANLTINISRAQEAIQEMHEVAADSGERLQGLLKEAQGTSEELQLVTEAANNLAARLENLAVSARGKLANPPARSQTAAGKAAKRASEFEEDDFEDHAYIRPAQAEKGEDTAKTAEMDEDPVTIIGPGFAIRDRDFEEGLHMISGDDEIDPERVDAEFEALTSRAERELASALKQRRRNYDA